MCWVSNIKPERKVADTDIKVFKILSVRNGIICSPVCYKEWTLGIESFVESINFSVYKNEYRIYEGYHTIKTIPSKRGSLYWRLSTGIPLFLCDNSESVYECVIPAGSVYYENEYGEVVSDRLIVLKKCLKKC